MYKYMDMNYRDCQNIFGHLYFEITCLSLPKSKGQYRLYFKWPTNFFFDENMCLILIIGWVRLSKGKRSPLGLG